MPLYHAYNALTNTRGDSLVGFRVQARIPNGGPIAPIYSDGNGTPISVISGFANTAITDDAGNYSFFIEANANYDLEYSTPEGVFVSATRNVPLFSGIKGDPGDTGASDSAFLTLAALKAIDPAKYPSPRLAAQTGSDGGVANGLFSYQTGNFTGRTDVVEVNGIPLTTGALVRQAADSIGYLPTLIPAPPRPVNRVLDDFPTLPSLGVTEGNTPAANAAKFAEIMAKARDLAVNTANPPRIRVPRGFYRYDTSPNFAAQGLTLDCEPGAQFIHTGSGRAFVVDGGATGGGVAMMKILGGLVVRGNANTTDGVYNRAIHHSTFDMEVQSVSNYALLTEWAVCNEYWFRCSPLFRPGFNPVPVGGMFLSNRGTGEATSRCNFYNPILEGINGYGINVNDGIINTFLGGTSESNVGGIFLGAKAVGNIIDGLDLEFNTTADVFCQGFYNTFRNLLSDSFSSFGGLFNSVEGGLYNAITSNGTRNSFRSVNFSTNAGAFTDTGADTRYEMMRNATANAFLIDRVRQAVDARYLSDMGVTGLLEADASFVTGGPAADTYHYKYGTGKNVFGGPGGDRFAHSSAGTSFNGVAPIGRRAIGAAATDAATTQALVNTIRQYLIDHGQCS